MLILGHRGASSAHPENTLEAFAAAYEGGAQGLEFDVRGDANNVPVLSHDRSLERRAGDARNVEELTVAELKSLDVGQGYKIPTFAEALTLAGGRGFLDIEVKQAGIEKEILAAVKGYRGQWGISCFDWDCSGNVPIPRSRCQTLAARHQFQRLALRNRVEVRRCGHRHAPQPVERGNDGASGERRSLGYCLDGERCGRSATTGRSRLLRSVHRRAGTPLHDRPLRTRSFPQRHETQSDRPGFRAVVQFARVECA
ncbi:MAG: glycerophosphodiester phosphodiesterase family protein [Thermomicrobiales bacterium]